MNGVKLATVGNPERKHNFTFGLRVIHFHILLDDCFAVNRIAARVDHAHLHVDHNVGAISVLGRQPTRSQEVLSCIRAALAHGK